MANLEISGVEIYKLEDKQLRLLSGKVYSVQVREVNSHKVPSILLISSDGCQNEWNYPQNACVRQIEESRALVVIPRVGNFYLSFSSEADCVRFVHFLEASSSSAAKENVFDSRTDSSSSVQYFQFYSLLSQQQNMLQDYIRTSTYQRALISNPSDFHNAVVLDVGAGSGILSFFAVQAGAKKVYAVEASSMAKLAERLFNTNGMSERVQVLEGKMEELCLPEPVDIIVSEPLGYMLLNERMLETFLYAKRWLKPNGRMFPSEALLFCAPFTDEYLYMELGNKAAFWYQQSFYGVDLSHLRDDALREYFRQPVVDTFDIRILIAQPERRVFDFAVLKETDLAIVDMPLDFIATTSANVHGLAFWFDVAFIGRDRTVWLSTAPTEPLTHWYQVRCLFPTPLFAQAGDRLVGRLLMTANSRQSYDVHMDLEVISSSPQQLNTVPPFAITKASNVLDLKSPYFRYTQVAQIPPGNHQASPTEQFFWGNAAATAAAAAAAANTNTATTNTPATNGNVSEAASPNCVAQPITNGTCHHPSAPQQQQQQQPVCQPVASVGWCGNSSNNNNNSNNSHGNNNNSNNNNNNNSNTSNNPGSAFTFSNPTQSPNISGQQFVAAESSSGCSSSLPSSVIQNGAGGTSAFAPISMPNLSYMQMNPAAASVSPQAASSNS